MPRLAAVIFLLVLGAGAQTDNAPVASTDEAVLFAEFKSHFSKQYATTDEEATRFGVFVENLAVADARNRQEVAAGGSAVHGVTRFSDLTQGEFSGYFLTARPTEGNRTRHNLLPRAPLGLGVNAIADWRGIYTTAIKDQGYW
jgi:hypothetical protein